MLRKNHGQSFSVIVGHCDCWTLWLPDSFCILFSYPLLSSLHMSWFTEARFLLRYVFLLLMSQFTEARFLLGYMPFCCWQSVYRSTFSSRVYVFAVDSQFTVLSTFSSRVCLFAVDSQFTEARFLLGYISFCCCCGCSCQIECAMDAWSWNGHSWIVSRSEVEKNSLENVLFALPLE